MTIRVLIADDHAVVRQGLRAFLSLSEDLETVGEAVDGRQAVELAHRLRPDLVLMDLLMPGADGINATATIRRELPTVQVLALSGYLDDHLIADALHAGAVGYLLKDTAAGELHRAIRAAAVGQVQLSADVAARLVRDVHLPGGPPRLTRREEEVIVLLARGRANGQIARELHITPQTVKTHVSNILSKLNSRSRTEAALHAMRVGLVPVHETTAQREDRSVRGPQSQASFTAAQPAPPGSLWPADIGRTGPAGTLGWATRSPSSSRRSARAATARRSWAGYVRTPVRSPAPTP